MPGAPSQPAGKGILLLFVRDGGWEGSKIPSAPSPGPTDPPAKEVPADLGLSLGLQEELPRSSEQGWSSLLCLLLLAASS